MAIAVSQDPKAFNVAAEEMRCNAEIQRRVLAGAPDVIS